MNHNRRRAFVAAAATCLLLATPVVTACSNAADSASTEVAGATSGDMNVTSSDGTQIQVGENVTLPSNWPSTMPTYDVGTLISVMASGDGATLNAIWTTDNAPNVAATAYGDALTKAGYDLVEGSDTGLFGGDYTGNGYSVNVVAVSGSDDTTTVLMNASKAAS